MSKDQRYNLNYRKTNYISFGKPRMPQIAAGWSASGENGRDSHISTEGFFQFPQTRADVSAPGQPWGGGQGDRTPLLSSLKVARLTQGRRARARGGRCLPGDFPLPPSFTCLAKNLPSSLRLFSFLAASKRSGVAATSRKRCSMTAGPLSPAATSAPYLARGAPEPLRSHTGGASN